MIIISKLGESSTEVAYHSHRLAGTLPSHVDLEPGSTVSLFPCNSNNVISKVGIKTNMRKYK